MTGRSANRVAGVPGLRVVSAEQPEPGDPATPKEESTEIGERSVQVEKVLDQLPEQYQRILRLRFLEGYSVREAAAEMGVSVANAKVLQHRALRRAAQLNGEVRGE
jgi:RNA polymerase sigma-70 factor (ECF subfamily)